MIGIIYFEGDWLLANGLKQISDCTGGRKMQFDTASQNKDILMAY